MLKGKDIVDSLDHMKTVIADWHIASLQHERGLDLESLEKTFKTQAIKNYHAYSTIEEGFKSALKSSDNIVIFGSFVTAANIKRYFSPDFVMFS
jgi:folylpolyglutamate synthase/dihydropteroate synthase